MKKTGIRLLIPAVLLCLLLPAASAADGTVQITGMTSSSNSITLEWEDSGASYYEICRANSKNGAYLRIGTTRQPTYRDTGLRSGQVYFYRVRPCWESRDGTRYGAFSSPVGQCCVNIIYAPAVQNPCYQQGKSIQVSGLMLHSVGCAQESGAVFASVWNQPSADVLVHAVIEPGGNVYQLADWNMRCWHCGGSGNDCLIGIEMTEPNELCYLSGDGFTWSGTAREKAIDNYNTAVALFANLCFQYNLNPLTDICSHREGGERGIASNHGDPEHLWSGLGLNLTMDTFRQDVQRKMQGAYQNRTVQETAGQTGTVTADILNVRSGPGTGYAVLTELYLGQTVAIQETRRSGGQTWGRLAFGGWICMTYVR